MVSLVIQIVPTGQCTFDLQTCVFAEHVAPPLGYALVGGVLLPTRDHHHQQQHRQHSGNSTTVHSATVLQNLQAAALALCQKNPVLLQGPSGAVLRSCCHVIATVFRQCPCGCPGLSVCTCVDRVVQMLVSQTLRRRAWCGHTPQAVGNQ
jgi:hypothetical protein